MRELSGVNFGLAIAYLLPGFILLVGVSTFSPEVHEWLHGGGSGPTIGGFFYVTLASLGAGLLASTVRWLLVDAIHHRTGIPRFDWNYAVLHERLEAFELLVESHYRYYQFYGNSLVAVAFTFTAFHAAHGWPSWRWLVAFAAVETLLWLGSRSTLANYARRGAMLLGDRRPLLHPVDA